MCRDTPLPYVLTILSTHNPADMSKSEDEVLHCRKAIWGAGSVALDGKRHFVSGVNDKKIK